MSPLLTRRRSRRRSRRRAARALGLRSRGGRRAHRGRRPHRIPIGTLQRQCEPLVRHAGGRAGRSVQCDRRLLAPADGSHAGPESPDPASRARRRHGAGRRPGDPGGRTWRPTAASRRGSPPCSPIGPSPPTRCGRPSTACSVSAPLAWPGRRTRLRPRRECPRCCRPPRPRTDWPPPVACSAGRIAATRACVAPWPPWRGTPGFPRPDGSPARARGRSVRWRHRSIWWRPRRRWPPLRNSA